MHQLMEYARQKGFKGEFFLDLSATPFIDDGHVRLRFSDPSQPQARCTRLIREATTALNTIQGDYNTLQRNYNTLEHKYNTLKNKYNEHRQQGIALLTKAQTEANTAEVALEEAQLYLEGTTKQLEEARLQHERTTRQLVDAKQQARTLGLQMDKLQADTEKERLQHAEALSNAVAETSRWRRMRDDIIRKKDEEIRRVQAFLDEERNRLQKTQEGLQTQRTALETQVGRLQGHTLNLQEKNRHDAEVSRVEFHQARTIRDAYETQLRQDYDRLLQAYDQLNRNNMSGRAVLLESYRFAQTLLLRSQATLLQAGLPDQRVVPPFSTTDQLDPIGSVLVHANACDLPDDDASQPGSADSAFEPSEAPYRVEMSNIHRRACALHISTLLVPYEPSNVHGPNPGGQRAVVHFTNKEAAQKAISELNNTFLHDGVTKAQLRLTWVRPSKRGPTTPSAGSMARVASATLNAQGSTSVKPTSTTTTLGPSQANPNQPSPHSHRVTRSMTEGKQKQNGIDYACFGPDIDQPKVIGYIMNPDKLDENAKTCEWSKLGVTRILLRNNKDEVTCQLGVIAKTLIKAGALIPILGRRICPEAEGCTGTHRWYHVGLNITIDGDPTHPDAHAHRGVAAHGLAIAMMINEPPAAPDASDDQAPNCVFTKHGYVMVTEDIPYNTPLTVWYGSENAITRDYPISSKAELSNKDSVLISADLKTKMDRNIRKWMDQVDRLNRAARNANKNTDSKKRKGAP